VRVAVGLRVRHREIYMHLVTFFAAARRSIAPVLDRPISVGGKDGR
jgi:hypothetical protein